MGLEDVIKTNIGPILWVDDLTHNRTGYTLDKRYTREEYEAEVEKIKVAIKKLGIKGKVKGFYSGSNDENTPIKICIIVTNKWLNGFNQGR